VEAELQALPDRGTASLHRYRRQLSRRLAAEPPATLVALARLLTERARAPGAKLVAFALLGQREDALAELDNRAVERFGAGMQSWSDVDMFACLLAGRAWRAGAIDQAVVHGWAGSSDRWWRRTALVATVPLNVRAQGGRGDPRRTLAVCRLLVGDRDDMVVKALSWALRELVVHDRAAVEGFVGRHAHVLAPRVLREVRTKLTTGLKNRRR
jgi:3-methyladenine DNA glycosylase AlkD